MSIATEISRIQTARNTLRTKAVALGIGTSTDKLDTLATAFDGITNRGAVSATVQEGDTYTIPEGYHNGAGTVAGVSGGGNYTLQSKTAMGIQGQIANQNAWNAAQMVNIQNLQYQLGQVVKPYVPNYALAPGYGIAEVRPVPPFSPVVPPATSSGGTTEATGTTGN